MISVTQSLVWRFGGPLTQQSPRVAWAVLSAAAIAGVGTVWWSYRRALVELQRSRRAILCLLRAILWLALLGCLAGPTLVQRSFEQPPARPLAVLVDQSGSMTALDNRQHRRLDGALRRWHEIQPAAQAAFSGIKYFAFADGLAPVASVDASSSISPGQTRFFDALQKVLASAPPGGWAGIVSLTDGIDTSARDATEGSEVVTRAALGSGTPLSFVIGRNHYIGGPFFDLREFEVPSEVLPKSTFRVEATFDSFQAAARAVPLHFTVNGVEHPAPPLRLEEGRRLSTWSTEIQTGDPGVIDLELRAGDEQARAAVKVSLPPSSRILYYQGALDWSYRFLADILKSDSTFALTPVFNFPNPAATLPAGSMRKMPLTEEELAPFEIVILANVDSDQLNPQQQAALGNWVRQGGVLLFLTPDDDSTRSFAGSELEKLLPVRFAAPDSPPGEEMGALSATVRQIRGRIRPPEPTQLVSYAWEATPLVREIFAAAEKKNTAMVSPRFSQYAHVAQAKPGAEVLARHPTDLAPGGNEHAILLAVQRYGSGQSGVMTTDALWRWKLNEPATDHQAAFFWQNLLAWLVRDRAQGIHFESSPIRADVGADAALRLANAGADKMTVTAALGRERIVLAEGPRESDDRGFHFQPPRVGLWQITAMDDQGRQTRHWLSVKKSTNAGELSGKPPDEELLRELAARTGGDILDAALPPSWQPAPPSHGEMLAERRQPLWHRTWVLAVLLGIFSLELVLRRRWKLI
jgi:hypothetical protein